jgi:hypothetical protein
MFFPLHISSSRVEISLHTEVELPRTACLLFQLQLRLGLRLRLTKNESLNKPGARTFSGLCAGVHTPIGLTFFGAPQTCLFTISATAEIGAEAKADQK